MKNLIPFNKVSYRPSHLSVRGACSRDRFQRFLQIAILLSFLSSLSLLLTGCPSSLKLLDKFKQEAAAGNYEWIATQPVDCSGESQDCRQLHLIKGDAHYALAKQGKDEVTNYTHAAEELALGIKLTKNWDNPSNRNQYYENFCESLRNLQDLQSGAEAGATGVKFLSAAEEFFQVDPGSFSAIYYVTKARLRQLQKKLLDVNDTNREAICSELNDLSNLASDGISKGQSVGGAAWDRYKANYQLLNTDIANAKRAAGCQ